MDNTIAISFAEYHRLINDSDILRALREFGVDNWDGYDEAIASIYKKETK